MGSARSWVQILVMQRPALVGLPTVALSIMVGESLNLPRQLDSTLGSTRRHAQRMVRGAVVNSTSSTFCSIADQAAGRRGRLSVTGQLKWPLEFRSQIGRLWVSKGPHQSALMLSKLICPWSEKASLCGSECDACRSVHHSLPSGAFSRTLTCFAPSCDVTEHY